MRIITDAPHIHVADGDGQYIGRVVPCGTTYAAQISRTNAFEGHRTIALVRSAAAAIAALASYPEEG